MNLHNDDLNWEKDAPHIASAGRTNPFLVPENYFSELTEYVSARVTIEELGKEAGLQVPEGYFGELPRQIEAKIAVEELKEELSTEGFNVPPGYFETLSQRIAVRTISEQKSSIRSMFPRWAGYAAAACITAVVGVAMYLNISQHSINNRLAEVPAGDIESYLNIYTDQTDVQVIEEMIETEEVFSEITSNISETELEQYIEETTL